MMQNNSLSRVSPYTDKRAMQGTSKFKVESGIFTHIHFLQNSKLDDDEAAKQWIVRTDAASPEVMVASNRPISLGSHVSELSKSAPQVHLRGNLLILVRILNIEPLLKTAFGDSFWLSVRLDEDYELTGCKHQLAKKSVSLSDAFLIEIPYQSDIDLSSLEVSLRRPKLKTLHRSESLIRRVASHLTLSSAAKKEEFEVIGKLEVPLPLILGMPDGLKGTFIVENRLRERIALMTMHIIFPEGSVNVVESSAAYGEPTTFEFASLLCYDEMRNIWMPVVVVMGGSEWRVTSKIVGQLDSCIHYGDISSVHFTHQYYMDKPVLAITISEKDANLARSASRFEFMGTLDEDLKSFSEALGRRVLEFR